MTDRTKTWRDRIWWFDLIYPITVAALLFGSLTYIVYSGQRSSRLGAMAEQELLEFSLLRGAGRLPRQPEQVLLVQIEPADIRRYGRAPYGPAPDASASVYARLIEKLSDAGAERIFVRWDAFAHPTDEVYFLPLTETLARLHGRSTVYLVVPSSRVDDVPEQVAALAKVLDDGGCHEAKRIQSNCPYQGTWDSWIVTALLASALPTALPTTPEIEADAVPWLTTTLPSTPPSFILNLSPAESLTRATASEILESTTPLRDFRLAFVGADQSHTLSGATPSPVTRFVRTVYDDSSVDITVAGTPLTTFWAQTAQMIIDGALVRVPREAAVISASAALCVAIVLVMILLGSTAALGTFLAYAAVAPFINAWMLGHFDLYFPLFDSYYFGLSTFLIAGFVRLSTTAFVRWRLEEQRRMHAHTADLKGNFISLLSHNLNTPVAKMQGMLALLVQNSGDPAVTRDVRQAEAQVAKLELAIRAVLIASALEEGSLAETTRNVRAVVDELQRGTAGTLKRLGVTVVFGEPIGDEDDDLLLPLAFDMRALHMALAALVTLFREGAGTGDGQGETDGRDEIQDRPLRVELDFAVRTTQGGDEAWLTVTASSEDGWLPKSAEALLQAGAVHPLRSLAGSSFYTDVMAGLILLTCRTYAGKISLSREDGLVQVSFRAGGRAEGSGVSHPPVSH